MPGVFEEEEGNQCDGSRVSRVDEAAGCVGGKENNGEERHVEASLAILMTLASSVI